MRMSVFGVIAILVATATASAQINGTYKPGYFNALSVQQNPTGFGDSNSGNQFANGSELDALYAWESGGNIDILVTGNLQSNFNKFVVFIDAGGPGQNTIAGSTGLPGNYNGMTFDAGFDATHWFLVNGDGNTWFVDGGIMGGGGGYFGSNNGTGALTGGSNLLGLTLGLNNSNTVGVTGGSAAGALTATTGIEFRIPLASLGLVSANFKITAFINGSGHDFASNQWLGSLPGGSGNLGNNGSGGLSNINLANIPGDQFVQIPAPGATALLGLAGLLVSRRRR